MFLRIQRLTENRVAPAVLLFHGARRGLHVLEGLGNSLGRVRDYRFYFGIDLEGRAAAWAGDFKRRAML